MANTLKEEILKHYGGHSANDFLNVLGQNEISEDEINCFSHSKYFDSYELGEVLYSHIDDFSMLSLNVQSLQSKFDSLISYLSYLQSHSFSFHAICLQETWLKDGQDTSLYQIPGYQLISQGKKCTGHGGLAVYLSTDYTYKILSMYDTSDIWEGLFMEITGDNLKRKITLANIYRPPKFNNRNDTIQAFTAEFRPIINKLDQKSSDVLIT